MPDVAIIDPPRNGSDEKTLMAPFNSLVGRIVYVSCNPSTLARDVKFLVDNRFKAEKEKSITHKCTDKDYTPNNEKI